MAENRGFFGFIAEMIGKIKPPNVVFGGVDISNLTTVQKIRAKR
jgi:hypothetical protein